MNCINCGFELPEGKPYDIPADCPTPPREEWYELNFTADPIDFGVPCDVCKRNQIIVEELLKTQSSNKKELQIS